MQLSQKKIIDMTSKIQTTNILKKLTNKNPKLLFQ